MPSTIFKGEFGSEYLNNDYKSALVPDSRIKSIFMVCDSNGAPLEDYCFANFSLAEAERDKLQNLIQKYNNSTNLTVIERKIRYE